MQRSSGPKTVVVAAAAIVGIAVIVYGVYRGWEQRQRTRSPELDPAVEAAKRAEAAEATAVYRTALDKILASPIAFTEEPCAAAKPMPPLELGDMSLAWPGDRLGPGQPGVDTRGYLMFYVRLTGSDVAIVPAATSGAPFEEVGFGVAAATLVVDRWIDPIVPADVGAESRFVVGQIEGRVLVWDRLAKRFACGAKVTATNTDVTVVTTTNDRAYSRTSEDSLSKVRVDLVNEALRAGLAQPMTTIAQ